MVMSFCNLSSKALTPGETAGSSVKASNWSSSKFRRRTYPRLAICVPHTTMMYWKSLKTCPIWKMASQSLNLTATEEAILLWPAGDGCRKGVLQIILMHHPWSAPAQEPAILMSNRGAGGGPGAFQREKSVQNMYFYVLIFLSLKRHHGSPGC